jgi:NAD(P)-dependent dehydrogenase (short-subunit alcohol dehydrogenase family)
VKTPELAGKVAVVTGASRGIGLAVADELRAAGAHVVRLARSLVEGSAERQTDIPVDLADAGSIEGAVTRVLRDLGVPDIVVNNAGVFFVKPIEDTTLADFAKTIAVNLTGPFLLARALVPHLKKKQGGHLVTIGSVSDHVGFSGSTAYAASKYGLRGMHDVIRSELAGSGVRATLISPGPVDTEIWDEIDPDSKPGFTKRKDMMRAEDVAEAVLWAVTRPARVDVSEIRLFPANWRAR